MLATFRMLRVKLRVRLSKLAKFLQLVLPEGVIANLGQWCSRRVYEPDFEIFGWLAETTGLVLDIGANRGESALSVLRHTRHLRVYSVEPNNQHRWGLILIRLLHPLRFRFRLIAAGDTFYQGMLHIPGRRRLGLDGLGSLDPVEFEKDPIRELLAESGIDNLDKSVFRQLPVRVIPLDSLGLSPGLIKLDVEGFELQALNGLQETLRQHRPALLIEMNNPERWMPLVKALGYDFYHYDTASQNLHIYAETEGVLNLLCLHADTQSVFTRVLLGKVQHARQSGNLSDISGLYD